MIAKWVNLVNPAFYGDIVQVPPKALFELDFARLERLRILSCDKLAQLFEPGLSVGFLLVFVFVAGAFPNILEIFLYFLEGRQVGAAELEVAPHGAVHDAPESQRRLRAGGNLEQVAELIFEWTG